VRIVDPETHVECADEQPGEVWVCSPSVAKGYWGKWALSVETFRARLHRPDGRGGYVPLDGDARWYLRTGDEGFLENGGLYICGRLKDMIIIGGKNYYPEDIEIALQVRLRALPLMCTP
jgi:acyl-CoA synthetase (AMP-forming)/AMP-acid ligase II